ncbi:MAG: carboxypeptidase regulatory-like domain-containing protein [Bacteroidales bacterium]|nr:carboxypeptidase regulatory-like domain-containing protein [Bacteroidales bacterium]
MKQSFKFLLSALAVMLAGVTALAQVTTSGLNGRVNETTGEPLEGAVVLATHVPSGTQYYAVANNSGQYVINGMRAGGPYTIQISYLGMSTLEYNNITLKLGEPYELDVKMLPSNELDAVVVQSDASFNASKTGAGASFSQAQVENLPTIDRSVYDIVKFTPQASVNKNGGISFAGSNNRYNSFQIDGAVANDSFGLAASGTNGGQTGSNPVSMDAIEEVQVVVAPFDVRQSGFTGGAINAITKSGTNTVKGSAYAYIFNQDMVGTTPGTTDMSDPMALPSLDPEYDVDGNKTGMGIRTKYTQELAQTYGFTVGAPIVKNKLFIFASGEFYRKSYPNIYFPSDGDGNAYINKPLKSEVTYNGENLGKVFNPAMADAILDHYQKTYNPDASYSESYSAHQIVDQSINAMLRLDWNINDSNKLMVRYQLANAFADQYGSGASTYYFNNSSYKQVNWTNTVVAELNSRVSDCVSNEFRATAVIVRDHREPGYPGATMYIRDNITFNLGTEYSSGANSMASDTYTITDNVSIFKGNHNITVGTHNEIFKFNNVFIQYAYGEYTFATLADFFNNNPNQYDYKFADPEITGGETIWAASTYAAEFGLYAQDEWKPGRNFTLTYGLRADLPVLLNHPTVNEDFNAKADAGTFGSFNEHVGETPKASVLFSPRVGFRWFLNDSHKSLLRGGAGLFTGRVPFVWLSNAYNNTGMETKSVTLNGSSSVKPTEVPATSDPYTDVIKAGVVESGKNAGGTINTLNNKFKYPQVFRANLGFDQEFEGGWKITLDALFSKTLNNVFFYNAAIYQDGKVYGVNAATAETNHASVAPHYKAYGDAYSTIVSLGNTNKGYTYSVSAQVQKSFDFGLDLMASYTFGHSYSVNDGTSSVAYSNWKYNYSIDTNSDELSYSLFDKPHKWNFVAMYTSPVYAKVLKTTVTLTYEGGSGQRYCYTMKEASLDFNGDGQKGNSLMYIPTQDELVAMNWASAADAAKFENFIRGDKYLSSHRGQWSTRYAGLAPVEHHFNFSVAEDIFYDKAHGRKIQINVNLLNASNLFNRNWGMYYASAYNRTILDISAINKDADGNFTPTYTFYDQNQINYSDFISRWRLQVGLKLTF